ncbi:hypothetical protein EV586_102601 [Tumebacillus sp. BK434]|nr:hypothetical protein EV586_102601 [Tumebacillus sp. BK434]
MLDLLMIGGVLVLTGMMLWLVRFADGVVQEGSERT